MLALHEDVFYEYFRPYRHPGAQHDVWRGHGLETFGADFELVRREKPDHLWTVADGDGEQWIETGVHFVNRICYLITEIPHNGLDVLFRIPSRRPSLTPLGLKHQMNATRRLAGIQALQTPAN